MTQDQWLVERGRVAIQAEPMMNPENPVVLDAETTGLGNLDDSLRQYRDRRNPPKWNQPWAAHDREKSQ